MMHNSSDNLEKELSLRVLIIGILTVAVLFTLMLRVTYIQVFKNRNYSERSKRSRESITRFPPIRGRIFSADGKVLANNVKSYDLVIDPKLLSKDNLLRQQELLYVSKVIGIDYPDLEKLLQTASKKREKLTLAENISFNDFIKISENLDKLPGEEVAESLIRN
jgi:penicillin-binding protein 2